MSKRFLLTILTLIIIASVAGVAIFLAKGYTFSPKERMIVGTGIISITSNPDAASVFIDGHLTTATNTTLSSLPPKEYSIKIVKEGFIPWERNVTVKVGLVTDLKIRLFPAIPTIYPLTFTGVKNPVLSPDSQKLAYIVPTGKKAGVWVWSLVSDQPIAFTRGAEPHQIAQNTPTDYTESVLRWSNDSKQILATVGADNYLLSEGSLNTEPRDITPILDSTLKSWDDDKLSADKIRILNIKNVGARKVASDSATLKWSPDETKFMYSGTSISQQIGKSVDAGKTKIYDLETNESFDIPEAQLHFWLPDSRHIVLVGENQVSIVDYDGTNNAVIYAGNFEDSLVFAWPDSSRLVLISSFPTPTASEPNLYGVNLR